MIYVHSYTADTDTKTFSRQQLRKNLASYLCVKASDVNISYNKNGKPYSRGIFFSVSHCRNKVVQAFTHEGELGVDLEQINPQRPWLQLANRYFSDKEHQRLQSMDKNEAVKLFFELWTAKEAVCKGHGGRLWHFLADNYLNENNLLINFNKDFYLKNYMRDDYSLTFACSEPIGEVSFI